ncbi:hypothetical protein [Agrobacterium tumefaciens]|uniref:hypothetical protein n=1 Tax=Agrobacterium tumefaciens TaxID=358 RepID=UPI001AEF267F|nr:hypothetical protein [Agrobacterium tumefaciens]
MVKFIDITGERFERLVAVERVENNRHGRARFVCRCDCGGSVTVDAQALRRNMVKSCGCFRREFAVSQFTKHGLKGSAEYRAWTQMKTRCLNPKNRFYHRYGGRGITICAEWQESFETFYRDMGPRPSKRHSIERKNNDEGYRPGNCEWALPAVQAANRSTVCNIEYNGISDNMAGWSRRTGIPYTRLRRRLRDGWPVGRALEIRL